MRFRLPVVALPTARPLVVGMSLLLCCGAAAAATADPLPAAPSAWRELLGIVVPLAFIIFALFLVWRLARRRYGLTGKDAPLSVLQILPVGPRERVVLVRTRAGRVFAVGVSTQSVNLVTMLDQSDLEGDGDPAESAPPPRRH